MADQDARPLTDEERAELEALRAEKARRERAELEALRADQAAAPATPAPAPAASTASAAPSTTAAAAPAAASAPHPRPVAPQDPVVPDDPAERTFGQRMVLSSDEDEDGLPSMPPAQKIVIGVCLVLAVVVVVYVALSNAGMIG